MNTKSLKQTRDEIKTQLQNLNAETLKLLALNRKKAEAYIKIGQKVSGGEILTKSQVKELTNEMQIIAKMLIVEKTGQQI